MIFTHCGLSKEGLYVSMPNSMKNSVSLDFGYVLSVLSTDLNHQITFTCLLPNSSRMFSNSQCLVIGLPWKPCTVVFVRFIFCFFVGFFLYIFFLSNCVCGFLFCFVFLRKKIQRRGGLFHQQINVLDTTVNKTLFCDQNNFSEKEKILQTLGASGIF